MCVICDGYEKNLSDTAAGVSSGLGNAGNYSNDYIDGLVWGGGWSGTVYYTIDDGPTYGGSGWLAHQETAIHNAVTAYNNICGLNFSYVSPGNSNVDIVFGTLDNASFESLFGISAYGVHEVPDGTDMFSLGGAEVCYGVYNWSLFNADTDSFDVGGYDYITLIHELGHGLGLAHPHDDGGSSSVYPGVTSSFGDYGDNNLNQGVFTTMSYNDGWVNQFSSHTISNNYAGYGYQGTPMAFDIAALQELYGANDSYQTGNNTYTLPTVNGDNQNTYWSCIWDAGGTDSISNSGSSIACTINLNAAPLTGANAGGYVSWNSNIVGGFTIANGVVIENATGGSGNDTLTGNTANNTIDGGAGNDTMVGGAGDDTYVVDSSSDVVTESSGEGTDIVKSSSISLSLANYANVENLTLTGSSNYNLTGNSSANTLTGNSGNNTIDGGAGNDTMIGGDGDDTYYVDSSSDVVTESSGEGNDLIRSSVSIDLRNYSNIEGVILTGSSNLTVFGTRNADTLTGNEGKNRMNGFLGDDTLIGGDGNDTYIVNAGNKTIVETSSGGTADLVITKIDFDMSSIDNVERIKGSGTNDIDLTGNSLNNYFNGNSGDNVLTGNDGNDRLNGGLGIDTLIGGDGNDTYVVDTTTDTIVETSSGGTADTIITSVDFDMSSIDNIERIKGSELMI